PSQSFTPGAGEHYLGSGHAFKGRDQTVMPSIAKLSFIGLEHVLPPETAFGMARGMGHRRPGGIVEIETSEGVTGVGEVFGNPLVSRALFSMVETFFAVNSVL